MRYHAYFLSTTDPAIKPFPRPINVNVKKKFINLEFTKKIPMENVQVLSMEYESKDKAFSVAKAGVGLVAAGPVGLVAGALGGKKVTSTLVIKYTAENGEDAEVRLEGKTTVLIKKRYDKIQEKHI